MRRSGPGIALALLACLAGEATAAQKGPQFNFSDLPPDLPPEAGKVTAPSLYEVFTTGDVSPLGVPADRVEPADLFDQASDVLRGANGHAADPREAAFWLKRAILVAPDPAGRRRAWAVMRLGALLYTAGEPGGHQMARTLWELAGAWNNAQALCNLGQLNELGDDVARPDPQRALVWYERARKAGCPQAEDAINRLRH